MTRHTVILKLAVTNLTLKLKVASVQTVFPVAKLNKRHKPRAP